MDYSTDDAYGARYYQDPTVLGLADNILRAVSTVKFVEKAKSIAYKGNHRKLNFRMGAYVCRGGRVLSKASNWGYNHAESRALKQFGYCFEGATIYVMRRNGLCSKPCVKCIKKIIDAGISYMVYVNAAGELIRELVSNYK